MKMSDKFPSVLWDNPHTLRWTVHFVQWLVTRLHRHIFWSTKRILYWSAWVAPLVLLLRQWNLSEYHY